jgi:amidohydrolase
MRDIEAVKQRVIEEVERRGDVLVDASRQIHARPELCYEEHFACDVLASICEGEGLAVERGAYGVETAFVARAGDGDGPTVAVLCEYDALPGIGHACGHNIIATAGLGAGLAAASVAADTGGRIVVMGTPAEEGGGGKILMGDAGAFAGVDAAMMVHPAGVDRTEIHAIAIATWEVTYKGQAAHAAAFPHRGRNALDAAVLGYNAVAALRQHIRPTERIHGVFTEAGDKPNIVPDHAVAQWYVRSDTIETLQPLKARVLACLEAGAAAAGCTMEHRATCPEYSDLRTNSTLIELYRSNSERLGRPLIDTDLSQAIVGSTDMGNVSYWVPSIHPMIKVSPPSVSIHSPEFTAHACSADGDRAVLDGAKAMAMTVVDLWLRPDAMAAVRAGFDNGGPVRDGLGREP